MKKIERIAEKIMQNGGKLYLAGGAVRDEILGIKSQDEDYCVTGLTATEFIRLFPESKIRGKAFAVFDIDGKEFVVARKDIKTGFGHKEFDIETNKNITIEEDLARRDITINAIAKDIQTNEIIDPFNGRKDIENKIIRAVNDKFKEDPLRVYRVARFAAKFGFEVDGETLVMMNNMKRQLRKLSSERVYTEFSKAMLSEKPSIFFEVLRKSRVLNIHFKEIYDLIGAEQPVEFHPEGDAYNHTMLVLDKTADYTKKLNKNRKLEIRFGALVHDIGKGSTPKEEYPHHYQHENRGVRLVQKFGNDLKMPNNLIKCGTTACKEHMKAGLFMKMKSGKKVDFIERVSNSVLGLDGLQIILKADREEYNDFEKIGKKCLEEINGAYIKQKYNISEGEEFGKKLHEERVLWMKDN